MLGQIAAGTLAGTLAGAGLLRAPGRALCWLAAAVILGPRTALSVVAVGLALGCARLALESRAQEARR